VGIRYLKIENEILRSKLPKRVPVANRRGRLLSRHALKLRFQRACCRALGPERAARVTEFPEMTVWQAS
jgi:hypothetical protein